MRYGIPRRRIPLRAAGTGVFLCAFLLTAAHAEGLDSPEPLATVTTGGTLIEPNGPETPWLRHPKRFTWSGRQGAGKARSVRWRRWGTGRTVGRGRTQFCLPSGTCGKTHVKFVASKKRGGSPEGDDFFYYCSLTARGRFDPRRSHPVTIRIPPPEPCDS